MDLVRNRTGTTAHRPTCPFALRAVMTLWLWATNRTPSEVAAERVHACLICRPYGGEK